MLTNKLLGFNTKIKYNERCENTQIKYRKQKKTPSRCFYTNKYNDYLKMDIRSFLT